MPQVSPIKWTFLITIFVFVYLIISQAPPKMNIKIKDPIATKKSFHKKLW